MDTTFWMMHLEIANWVNFLAGFGAVVLTFLAGAEIDPHSLRENYKQSIRRFLASR